MPTRSSAHDRLVAKCRAISPTHACSQKIAANGKLRVLSNRQLLDQDLDCECDDSVSHGVPKGQKHNEVLAIRNLWNKELLSWFVRVLLSKSTTRTLEGGLDAITTTSTPSVPMDLAACSANNPRHVEEVSCPTVAREAWKQRRKQGLPVKKREKVVEDHYDDCGLDLSGLEDREQARSKALCTVPEKSVLTLCKHPRWFTGTASCNNKFAGVNTTFKYLTSAEHKPVVCEICGGEARLSQLLTSNAGWEAGTNYDLVCGIDLSDPSMRDQALKFLARVKCALLVMSPPCTPFGALGKWNHQLNHDAWTQSASQYVPLAVFAGHAAQQQLHLGCDFVIEQPLNSWLFTVDPWPSLRKCARISREVIDMCMLGAKTAQGLPYRKRTELWASDSELLEPLRNLECDNSHEHAALHGQEAFQARVWPWKLACLLQLGAQTVLSKRLWQNANHLWSPPELHNMAKLELRRAAASTQVVAPAFSVYPCLGCRFRVNKHDTRHNRVHGECLHPDVQAIRYLCPGCATFKARYDASHTYELGAFLDVDEKTLECTGCRFAVAPHRQARGPRVRTGADPTTKMRPAAEAEEDAEVADTGGAASSGVPRVEEETERDVAPDEDAPPAQDENALPEGRRRRDRRVHHDVEVQAMPDGDARWPHLDVNQALRMLQHPTDKGVILRTLRRLHVKWFHASADQMHRVLKAAGIPSQVLRNIPQITDSCKICRSWARPTEHSKTSIRLSTRFNESVQLDVLYWTDYQILHLMDECTKWCVAEIIGGSDDQELMTSITLKWFQPFGAPSHMIVDGEKGLASEAALHWLSSWGVERIPRAPNQHAHLIERHHQILRDLLHKVQDQHDEEGLVSAPQLLLAECVLAKNTMLSIAGESPYHALYGRTPRLLPEVLDRQGLSVLEDKPDDPLLVRNHHRIRELALENIVRENARRRLQAAA
eukprot:3060349-Amphidinium_carterae.1